MNRWLASNVGVDAGACSSAPCTTRLGGHVQWLISGGAALPRETQELFAGLGLRLTEGYGLTEAAPVLTVARPGKRAWSRASASRCPAWSCGSPTPTTQGVGEVVARGPNVMVGYTDDEATRGRIDAEGWLHTGDLGRSTRRGGWRSSVG